MVLYFLQIVSLIFMKCQTLLWSKNKKNVVSLASAEFYERMLSIEINKGFPFILMCSAENTDKQQMN